MVWCLVTEFECVEVPKRGIVYYLAHWAPGTLNENRLFLNGTDSESSTGLWDEALALNL